MGSALMRDLNHALTLIEAVVQAVQIPVTLKMRTGWDKTSLNAPELAHRAEQAGVSLVTVHGRTRAEGYGPAANWEAVGEARDAIDIPVVANGSMISLVPLRSTEVSQWLMEEPPCTGLGA